MEEERRLEEYTVLESKSVMTVEIVVALGEDELESRHGVMTVFLPSPAFFMRGVVVPLMVLSITCTSSSSCLEMNGSESMTLTSRPFSVCS